MEATRRIRLSKFMSYLLRHRPDKGGLVLDSEGMAPLGGLLEAIRSKREFADVTAGDLAYVAASCDKQRFRVQGDRIGARYGHSHRVAEAAFGEAVTPPEILYHGTPRRVVASILAHGLQPQKRQFVHLSSGPGTARRVGNRRDAKPTLLVIKARAAHDAGLRFYAPTPETYLVSHVPPEYITLHAGEEPHP